MKKIKIQNTTPLNEELDKILDDLNDSIQYGEGVDLDYYHSRADLKQELTNLIQTIEKKAKVLGELEGLKKVGCCDYWEDGCSLNVCSGQQLDRIAELEALGAGIPPNNTTTRSKE
jgi:hypothetical protein